MWYSPILVGWYQAVVVPFRQDVDLAAECRHAEVVDDVLGHQGELHRPVDGEIKPADRSALALRHVPRVAADDDRGPVLVLSLPHPLLAGDEDLLGVGGRMGA